MTDERADEQSVFKALADPTRRRLLDRLRTDNGATLSALCADLQMRRQSVTQHLDLLIGANLVSVHRNGRERLHYLNPIPIQQLHQRWISRFDEPRLQALETIKRKAEAMSSTQSVTEQQSGDQTPEFVYVTYIQATPQQVWDALTDPDITAQYWGHRNVSDWQVGSEWKHIRTSSEAVDVVGEVIAAEPPRMLETIWRDPDNLDDADRVRYLIEEKGPSTKLTVTHSELKDAATRAQAANGWRAILANLKTLLETGKPIAVNPRELA